MEDRLLVFRCKRGCKRSLARIYEKYRKDLVRLAIALLNDTSAAEDVVHDTFAGFVVGLGEFHLTGSLKGYLVTCVANRARNHNKARRERASESLDCPETASPAPGPLDRIVCNEQLQRLAGALDELPLDQREVVALHLYGQMTFRAMAESLGVSENTLKARYRYGLDKLRHLLNSEKT